MLINWHMLPWHVSHLPYNKTISSLDPTGMNKFLPHSYQYVLLNTYFANLHAIPDDWSLNAATGRVFGLGITVLSANVLQYFSLGEISFIN